MIITCNNCKKKFDIDNSLIPEKGRLVQCNNCSHKWFFRNEVIDKAFSTEAKLNDYISDEEPLSDDIRPFNQKIELSEINIPKSIELLDDKIEPSPSEERFPTQGNKKGSEDQKKINSNIKKNKKNSKILKIIAVYIISFIAFFIALDTLKVPVSEIIPNIDLLLFHFYQTINDIFLFFFNLI